MPGPVGFLDTNVLVRHFTGEPKEAARKAGRLLRKAEALFLPDVVAAEVSYVLEKHYGVRRPQVAAALRTTVSLPTVHTLDRDVLLRTLEIYEVHRLAFADAYLVALAEASGQGSVISFDRGIDRVGTVTRIEP